MYGPWYVCVLEARVVLQGGLSKAPNQKLFLLTFVNQNFISDSSTITLPLTLYPAFTTFHFYLYSNNGSSSISSSYLRLVTFLLNLAIHYTEIHILR